MNYNYKVYNPGGNLTALVMGDNYTAEERKIINDEILFREKAVEQVGFISEKEYRLTMAGGEFCVNATRCAVYHYLKGNPGEIMIEVSGCRDLLRGCIDNEGFVSAEMKIPERSDLIREEADKTTVTLDGITFLVIKDGKDKTEKLKSNPEEGKKEVISLLEKYNDDNDAIGAIFSEKENNEIKIHPVVRVKSVDTAYYETACGSGSAAYVIANNLKEAELVQPSGYSLFVERRENKITIKGKVI